jgi:hypothetical protein
VNRKPREQKLARKTRELAIRAACPNRPRSPNPMLDAGVNSLLRRKTQMLQTPRQFELLPRPWVISPIHHRGMCDSDTVDQDEGETL